MSITIINFLGYSILLIIFNFHVVLQSYAQNSTNFSENSDEKILSGNKWSSDSSRREKLRGASVLSNLYRGASRDLPRGNSLCPGRLIARNSIFQCSANYNVVLGFSSHEITYTLNKMNAFFIRVTSNAIQIINSLNRCLIDFENWP